MAQKRRSRRVQVQSSDQAVGTGVYAPSQVATKSKAAQNAFGIAQALGVAGDAYGMKVKHDLNKGYEDAMAGNVTEEDLENLNKSRAYVRGATQKIAEARAIVDAQTIVERYQTEFDKTGSMEDLDKFLRGAYEELYGNLSPGLYKAVLPHMERSVSGIMGSHAKLMQTETQQTVQDSIVVSAQKRFQTGPVTAEDWSAMRSEALALTGNTDTTNALLMSAVEQHVAESGDYALWDEPYLEKLKTNPKYADRAAKSQDDARKAADKAFQDATIVERATIEADLIERAQQADPTVMTDLRSHLEKKYVDEEIVRNVVKQYANAVVEGISSGIRLDAFFDGETAYHDLSDDDYNDTAKAAQAKLVADHGDQEGMKLFLDGVAANGRMPKFLKRQLDHASPRNPQAFNDAYGKFAMLRSADPAGYQRLMSEETQLKFESYELVLEEEGDPQRAINRMTEVRPELLQEVPKDEYNRYLNEAIGDVADGPFFNNADEMDPQLRRTVKKRYNHMIALGYQPERAAEFAVNDIHKRYTIHNGVLWPNEAKANTEALDFQLEQSKLHDGEGRDYEIVPAAGRPGYAFLRPKGGLAFGGDVVKVSDINSRYDAAEKARRDHAAREQQAQVKQSILDKAMGRATGIYRTPVHRGMSEELFRSEREKAWNKLTPAEQNAVIEEIEQEAQRAKDREALSRANRAEAARSFSRTDGIL